jgi:hypothetical protein
MDGDAYAKEKCHDFMCASFEFKIKILGCYILSLGISHVGKSHKRQNSAIAILLNKCDNNYS